MEMDKLSREAGMTLPKGAGPHVDEAAAKLILKKGYPLSEPLQNSILPIRRKRSAWRIKNVHRKSLQMFSASFLLASQYGLISVFQRFQDFVVRFCHFFFSQRLLRIYILE